MTERTIAVDYLARVEGEGSLKVRLKDREVEEVHLRIFEPPRFFEAFLRERDHAEAPDITARICGICPVAYMMSSAHAMERALGVSTTPTVRRLRRLLYCGEWIESHALHIYLLHAPDFLGYPDALTLAKDHPDAVRQGLALKKVGNQIVELLGGREIHPVNVRIGGFYRLPTREEFAPLRAALDTALAQALATVRFVGAFPFPEVEEEYEFVALRHPDEYPMNEGRLVSSGGLDFPVSAFEDRVVEEHVAHSHALHAYLKGQGSYLVGPLARYSLNFDRLTPLAQQAARAAGLGPVCDNPYRSIVVRAVEIVHACDEALALIAEYEEPEAPAVPVEPRAGVGYACTEAPRGSLYHRYEIDEQGAIRSARIVPPTSQNQKTIEADLFQVVQRQIDLPTEELSLRCEQVIRNYDPCISCATHFLKLQVVAE